MKVLLLTCSFLLACITLHAENFLLEGTIGTYPIIFYLYGGNGETEASYFYKSTCADLQLKGTQREEGILLYRIRHNYKTYKDDTVERWRLGYDGKKGLKGTWKDNKGKQLAVVLHPVSIETVHNPYGYLPTVVGFKESQPYEYLRTAYLPIVKDKIEKSDTFQLQYFHLKNSKLKFFTLVANKSDTVLSKVNALLMDKFIDIATRYCGCNGNGGAPNFDYAIRNVFLTENVLSVHTWLGVFCEGNAHPSYGMEPITIDMKTGEQLILQDVLPLGNAPIPLPNRDAWSDYEKDVYGPKLMGLMKNLYPEEMVASTSDTICNYAATELWQHPDWYIDERGIYIAPSISDYIYGMCGNPEWSYIPFDVLKKYKNPKRKIALP